MTLELHEPAGATPLKADELLGLKAKHIAIAALRAADQYDFDPLVTFVRSTAR